MDDGVLVIRCRQGSSEALRAIYDKYRDSLLILAIALLRDVNTAEDAVHDVFLRFAESAKSFELKGSLKAYLAVCVANRARDLIQKQKRQAGALDEAGEVAANSNEPGHRIECNEELLLLSSALAQLPHEQREVISLRIYTQMRFGAIAKSLGVSVNTAKGRYRYGIEKLRSILDKETEK